MLHIPLTQGKFALLDDMDVDLAKFRWFARRDKMNWYAGKNSSRTNGRGLIHMHRVIMERKIGYTLSKSDRVDHLDHDGLNNTRDNLRLATNAGNQYNQRCTRLKKISSQYKGVAWYKRHSTWRAQINCKQIVYHLGYFENEIDAALAYDKAASKYFGEFANLNFPKEVS